MTILKKPTLQFKSAGNPAELSIVEFDGFHRTTDGELVLWLNLRGTESSVESRDRILLAIQALHQNQAASCRISIKRASHAAFAGFLHDALASYGDVFKRIELDIS